MPANREIWILGDSFLTLAAQHLEYWKEYARRNPHEALFMLHWFDVKVSLPQTPTNNAAHIITSALVNMLNTRPKLPHTMIVMLGGIKFWCDDHALKYSMDAILIGLLVEIKRIIQQRQEDLPVKALGPDPAIYFVKLHWRPEMGVDSIPMYPKKRRTFNRLLDTIMRPRNVRTISLNEITVKVNPEFFLAHGNLSEQGYRQLWKSLSEALEEFRTYGKQKPIDFVANKDKLRCLSSNDSDVGDTNVDDDHGNPKTYRFKKKRFFKKANRGRGNCFNRGFQYF